MHTRKKSTLNDTGEILVHSACFFFYFFKLILEFCTNEYRTKEIDLTRQVDRNIEKKENSDNYVHLLSIRICFSCRV
jgi:hypothetical protein